MLVEVGDTIDDRLRLLRGCTVVEPDERMSVDGFAQNGKITANGFHVEGVGREAEIAQERDWSALCAKTVVAPADKAAGLAISVVHGRRAEAGRMRHGPGELRCIRSEGAANGLLVLAAFSSFAADS